MSLYNMIFGMNPDSDKLLSFLGKTKEDFGRFRNVYMEDGHIVVYTRCGGGNRDDYEEVFDEMSTHPWYSHNADDDYDCTYASIYFKIPEGIDQTFVALHGLDEGAHPEKQWEQFMEDFGAVNRAVDVK